jgi:hypothetical protein
MCPIQGGSVEVSVHSSGNTTIAGAGRCGSMAACPVCAETGRRTRAGEIDALVAKLLGQGHHVFFVTETMAHRREFPLRIAQRAMNESHRLAWSGRAMADAGYLGQVKAWDYTYGANGWHPHLHCLIVIGGWVDRGIARSVVHQRFDVYKRALVRRHQYARRNSYNPISGQVESVGWDVQDVTSSGDLARYTAGVSKLRGLSDRWSVGKELAASMSKRSSVSPWSILRAAVDGEVPPGSVLQGMTREDLWALWREYETATKGLKQIVVGRNLQTLGAIVPVSDEDAVAGRDESAVVYSETFSASEWDHVVRCGSIAHELERIEQRAALLCPGSSP